MTWLAFVATFTAGFYIGFLIAALMISARDNR
jgi:biotin transporter BioY